MGYLNFSAVTQYLLDFCIYGNIVAIMQFIKLELILW